MKVLTNIDMNKNEVQNIRLQQLASDPASADLVSGMVWMNTSSSPYVVKYYDGSNIITIGAVNFETSASNIKVAGTASVGSLTTVPRADHVHPAQTSVSGNAGTATKLETKRGIDGVEFDGSADIIHFGTCSTGATTADKTVSCTGFKLAAGSRIIVKHSTMALIPNSGITLNVNSTGAKSVYYKGALLVKDTLASIPAGTVMEYVYDGTNWEIVGGFPYQVGTSSVLTTGTNEANSVWSPKILHDYISSAIGGADAMRFKGTIGTGGDVTTLPTTDVKVGDTYRVITAGTYAGETCEIGDLIIATATTPTWTVAQTNIDGAITSISGTSPVSVTGTGASRTISVSTATTSASGLMSSGDKTVVNAVERLSAGVYKNPALTQSSGVCSWTISHGKANAIVDVYEMSTKKMVIADVTTNQEAMTSVVSFISSSNIAANTYFAVVVGVDIEY